MISMTRKWPLACLIFSIFLVPLEGQNRQTIYSIRSEELIPLEAILLTNGYTPPFPVRPHQGITLEKELDRIEVERLSESELEVFRWTRESLSSSARRRSTIFSGSSPLQFSIRASLSLEGYAQSRKETTWELRDADRLPLLSFPFQLWGGDTLYGYLGLEFRKLPPHFLGEETVKPVPISNIPLDVRTLDGNLPFRAFLATGGSFWGIQFGRDRLSWGNGVTGNFILHDNPLFYNFVRLILFNRLFQFTTLWANMEHQTIKNTEVPKRVERNWLGHRVDIRVGNSFQLALTEAILISAPTMEMKYLNPLMVYHSWYLDETESNLIASFEASYVPTRGVSLYVQMAVNQFTLPIERNRSYAQGEPDAYAFLLGSKLVRFLERGFVLAGIEGSLTSPWLYIHRTYQTQYYYTQMIMVESVGHRVILEKPLGYPTGPDTANLYFYALYQSPGSTEWRGDLTLRFRGELSFQDISKVFIPAAGIHPPLFSKNARTPSGEAPEFRTILRIGFTQWLDTWHVGRISLGMDLYGIFTRNRGAIPSAGSFEAQGAFRVRIDF